MSYVLEILEEVQESVNEIYRFHEDRKPGEGTDILAGLWDKIEAIEQNPNQYQVRYKDRRAAPVHVRSFQYHIIYRIESPKVIVIDFVSQSSNWRPV